MIKPHPVLAADTILAGMGCPESSPGQMYLLYDVSEDAVETELTDRPWDIRHFVKGKEGVPLPIVYTNLFYRP